MATITVSEEGGGRIEVLVEEAGSASQHSVEVDEDYYQELTGGQISKKELVRRSFEFLLQREPKESILSRFDLKQISNYFPSYEGDISL
ncbi:MAG: hypothetical protein ACOC7T_04695 [Planctomycetota bacterium]